MAEEEAKAEPEPQKKKRPTKLILIVAGAVVLLGGGGVAAALLLGGNHASAEGAAEAAAPAAEKHGEAAGTAGATKELGPVQALDSFIVNLADEEQSRYLKLTAHLELANAGLAKELEKRNPQIRDAILTLLAGKTFAEVADAKGKVKLRREMILRLNDILGEGAVSQVYFTEFIVQ